MWYTTGVLFLFSRHIIRIDVLARVFSSFYPSRKKKNLSYLSRLTTSANKPLSGMSRGTTAVVKTLPLMLNLPLNTQDNITHLWLQLETACCYLPNLSMSPFAYRYYDKNFTLLLYCKRQLLLMFLN